jgi:hypothetical protein
MKISLKTKRLKNNRLSLFIEFYKGYSNNKSGVKKHLRKFEYLKLYVSEDPKNADDKRKDKQTWEFADNILAIRKAEYIQGKYNIKDNKKAQITFLDYYEILKEDRYATKGNYDNWDAALKHIERYCPEYLQLKAVDTDFVKGFKKYLDTKARTKVGTPLSQNSKYTYFNKFKAALREAYTENYLEKNVLRSVKGFEQGESTREYLTHSELQALAKARCNYPVLKNAFLFSCLVGLRWSDINKLK